MCSPSVGESDMIKVFGKGVPTTFRTHKHDKNTKTREKLTISPFRLTGGSQDTITFVPDAGIALMSCGADGTVYKATEKKTPNISKNRKYTRKSCCFAASSGSQTIRAEYIY